MNSERRWKQIFDVIKSSSKMLTKYEIAEKLNIVYGINIKPDSVRFAISKEWEDENFSIYAEWDGNHYVYGCNDIYYWCNINGYKGV